MDVWADSAYRSAEIEAALKDKGLRSRIHRKGRRNKPPSAREKKGNKTRSSVRVRVEHVFGARSNDMGGTLVRSVGLVRAKARVGLKDLAYKHASPGPTGAPRGGGVTILGGGDRPGTALKRTWLNWSVENPRKSRPRYGSDRSRPV